MNDPLHYRLVLEADPSPALLRALRATFVDFTERPVAHLARALRSRRRWVVCAGADVDEDALKALGARVEPVGIYDAGFVRSRLPRPSAFDQSFERLVIVVLPSFDPEVVLHVWAEAGVVRFHATSPEVSLYACDFVLTQHREGDRTWWCEDTREEERAWESSGALADETRLRKWVRTLSSSPAPLEGWAVADGTGVRIEASSGYERYVFEGRLDDAVASRVREIVEAARAAGVDGALLDRVDA